MRRQDVRNVTCSTKCDESFVVLNLDLQISLVGYVLFGGAGFWAQDVMSGGIWQHVMRFWPNRPATYCTFDLH